MKPDGMWCLAAVRSILQKQASPAEHDVGGGSELNFASVSASKPAHLAFLMLVYLR